MTSHRWADVERLYHDALELPEASREAFVARACEGDAGLQAEVMSLLAHDDPDGASLERPAIEITARLLASEGVPGSALVPGRVVGHYRLVRPIGHGGMGEVFLADDLSLHRRVALKFLPSDLASDSHARAQLVREARAASALAHPNIVTVHSIDDADGLAFIVMEYVEGDTLKTRIEHGPLPLAEVLDLGVQMAEALGAAHAVGLVHRDIKPANIVFTRTGQVKILDFGIATYWNKGVEMATTTRPTANPEHTAAGLIRGTASYMSPEQTRGEPLDPRADVFSLGAVLYEAASGTRPFAGPDVASIVRGITSATPPLLSVVRQGLPRELDEVITRALAKNAAGRYGSAQELADALRAIQQLGPAKARRRWRQGLAIAGVALVIVTGVFGVRVIRDANRRSASDAIVQAGQLAGQRRYREAYALVVRARRSLPDDPSLSRIADIVADHLSVVTEPAGARVYVTALSDAARMDGGRRFIGTSPVAGAEFARDDYVLDIMMDGFAPVRRTISSALVRTDRAVFDTVAVSNRARLDEPREGDFRLHLEAPGPLAVTVKMAPATSVPAGMVFVPGGPYRLVAAGKPVTSEVHLDDYYIDMFEVSNREFRQFIDAGGYDRREFWNQPIVQDGRTLEWPVAMALFRDRTGRPGPRSWSNQMYPAGQDNHPVTDITWYEAGAYAAFRGRRLPTVFQWEKAARDGQYSRVLGYVMPWGLVDPAERLSGRANFLSTGTVPVDQFPFGASPFGAYQMAGNVAEWCLNARPRGHTVAGGSWQDPLYLFGLYGTYPSLYAANTIGFRTVAPAAPPASDQGAMPLAEGAMPPAFAPVGDAVYRTLLTHYRYDAAPLDAAVTDTQDAADWTRERITYSGAGGERAIAYLYLPKRAARPLQVIHYVPSDSVIYGLTVPEEVEVLALPLIRAGRAVFAVVNKGFTERRFPAPYTPPDQASVRYREVLVNRSVDLQRGLDYLVTRPDIDMSRLAGWGTSIWSAELVPFAVEHRYRAIVLLAAGIPKSEISVAPEANAVNFVSRYGAPTLMLVGRHDESISYEAEAEPLFKLLPAPKSLRLFDGGHIPPLAMWMPVLADWLDARLGPVRGP